LWQEAALERASLEYTFSEYNEGHEPNAFR
jgi:hypothetical protein